MASIWGSLIRRKQNGQKKQIVVKAYILNGPNLNLLGEREPDIYGHQSLADIETALRQNPLAADVDIEFRQSNSEGELVDWVQEAGKKADGLIFNPGAYSHTSIALLDALSAISIPRLEVHLSNVHAREAFREKCITAKAANSVIMGLGAEGYTLALIALKDAVMRRKKV